MTNILIVEDDVSLNQGIALSLKGEDIYFTQCYDISGAKRAVGSCNFDLIILDINLPDGSGLDLCKAWRMVSSAPVLFITANDTELDMIIGLESGGDDYITKPFSLAVLRARVSALLRRTKPSAQNLLQIDNFNFDFESMRFAKAGILIELSKTEQRLLYLLVTNRGNTVKRSRLLEQVWPDGTEFVDENALSVVISRLRNKLEDDPKNPKYIKTVYGTGYIWAVVS